MNSNSDRVVIPEAAAFCAAFGSLGSRVGPRTGAGKRTQDQKEWYVVRRFLKEAMATDIFRPPISIWKANPPQPDFEMEHGPSRNLGLIEITEATHPADQREMTEFELGAKTAMLIGELGGRFSGGAGEPGHIWAADILDAVQRKAGKAIFVPSSADRHLVVYPNSNASFLISDEEHERVAFSILHSAVILRADECIAITGGCSVHILGKELICFDVLGQFQLVKRSPVNVALGQRSP